VERARTAASQGLIQWRARTERRRETDSPWDARFPTPPGPPIRGREKLAARREPDRATRRARSALLLPAVWVWFRRRTRGCPRTRPAISFCVPRCTACSNPCSGRIRSSGPPELDVLWLDRNAPERTGSDRAGFYLSGIARSGCSFRGTARESRRRGWMRRRWHLSTCRAAAAAPRSLPSPAAQECRCSR
jgi:hypothetical protein